MSYEDVVKAVAAHLDVAAMDRPIRVAIDGRTACGKSTFARALSAQLSARGRTVLHTTIDGFHNPKSVRHARGRMSAEDYYRDARDLAAIRRALLDPLGPGGDRRVRTETFDLGADLPVTRPEILVPNDAILLVDGTFLARAELSAALFDQRYLPAFDLYAGEAAPEARADIVIDLEDFDDPRIVAA